MRGSGEVGGWFISRFVRGVGLVCRGSAGRVIGSGICDMCDQSLSSVYFYFEPAEARRGLGTFSALKELAAARRMGVPYYYLGYWIDGCMSMQYKARFNPHEFLGADGIWRGA